MTQRGYLWRSWATELAKEELFVIHAMPLREKYRAEYEEAAKWRM
jgi:hypothetical protein